MYIHTYMHAYIRTCLCIIDALGGLFQRVCVCARGYTLIYPQTYAFVVLLVRLLTY